MLIPDRKTWFELIAEFVAYKNFLQDSHIFVISISVAKYLTLLYSHGLNYA